MITVLTGPNSRGLQDRLRAIIAEFKQQHGDSIERFDGTELTSTDPVIDAVRSVSFLEPRKLVIVRDFGQHTDLMNSIEGLVEQTADSTDVVLVDQKLDKRTAGYKYLQKNVAVETFAELSPRDMARWVKDYATQQGGSVSAGDAQYLVDRVGANQQYLQQELDKLVLYSSNINRSSIDALTDQTPQGKVFAMLDELFRGNNEHAWRLYQDQRAQGEEPHKLLAMINWQLSQLTIAVYAPRRDVATLTAAGISSFGAQKLLGMARSVSREQVKRYVDDLAQVDLQTKTSADVESALAVYFSGVSTTF